MLLWNLNKSLQHYWERQEFLLMLISIKLLNSNRDEPPSMHARVHVAVCYMPGPYSGSHILALGPMSTPVGYCKDNYGRPN